MTLTFSQTTIEITRDHAYAHSGDRAAYIQFGTGLPLGLFSKERGAGILEVWGLGLHAIFETGLMKGGEACFGSKNS